MNSGWGLSRVAGLTHIVLCTSIFTSWTVRTRRTKKYPNFLRRRGLVNSIQQNDSRAWMVAISGTIINLCLGVLYAWSVFSKALQDNLGFTATETSIPYSVAVIVFALFMVPAGIMLDRLGPRDRKSTRLNSSHVAISYAVF